MMYSKTQYERIIKLTEIIHSTPKRDISLCQYDGLSCVRCCLPHIGGDFPRGIPEGELSEILKNDKARWYGEFEHQYVGPKGIKMKFISVHPRIGPGMEASHYEDSFQDVGQQEMERRFERRREKFTKIYDPQKAAETLDRYIHEIQEEEGYSFKTDRGLGLFTLFFGGNIPVKEGNLPECQLLAYAGNEVGCLAHPLSPESKGIDGRELAGFFKNTDSCRISGCEWAKEFPYLSDSALRVFKKATEGMSWYEYSRHSTAVLVAYLRAFDFLLEMMDKRDKLESKSLDEVVEFTNDLFDNWEFPRPVHFSKSNEKDWRLPRHYAPGKSVTADKHGKDILLGTFEESRKYANINRRYWEDLKEKCIELKQVRDELRDRIVKSLPYAIVSTLQGYKVIFDKRHEVHVDLQGNRLRFRDNEREFLCRIGYDTREGMNEWMSGKDIIMCMLKTGLGASQDAYLLDIPVKERLLHVGLMTHFFKQWQKQMPQVRECIERAIDNM